MNCDGKRHIPLLPFHPSNLRKWDCRCPHLTDEETETWIHQFARKTSGQGHEHRFVRSQVPSPRFHSRTVRNMSLL